MFLLAALDNAYRQLARAADALLTSWSPLTYELGDYMDGTEKLDPDWEPTEGTSLALGLEQFARGERVSSDWLFEDDGFGECECVCDTCCAGDHCDAASCATLPDSPVGVSTSPLTVPPTGFTHDHAAGVEASPTPPAAFKLPMYDASDLIATAEQYIGDHVVLQRGRDALLCMCGKEFSGRYQWGAHVGEIVVSAVTFELTGLAYEQSHPQTAQES